MFCGSKTRINELCLFTALLVYITLKFSESAKHIVFAKHAVFAKLVSVC